MIKVPEIQIIKPQIYYENTQMIELLQPVSNFNSFNLQKISSSHFTGSISVDSGQKLLLLSIPYENGWNITIDGIPIKQFKVVESLMAVPVQAGKHSIDLRYFPDGLLSGIVVSSFFVLIFVLFILRKRNSL